MSWVAPTHSRWDTTTRDIAFFNCDPLRMALSARRPILVVVVVTYAVGFVGALGLGVSNAAAAGVQVRALDVALSAAFASVPLVGALIEWYQPRNRLGRLLLGIGLGTVGGVFAQSWAVHALRASDGSLPGGPFAAWIAAWLFVPSIGAGPWFVASFPSGRIASRRLRQIAVIGGAGLFLATVSQALSPGRIDGVDSQFAPIANPLGIGRLRHVFGVTTTIGIVALVVFGIAAVADLVIRYLRSESPVRDQLRWLAAALPVLPISMLVGIASPERFRDGVIVGGQCVFLVGTAAGISIAILRHRVLGFDVMVRDSVQFAMLSVLVVAVYVVVVGASNAVLEHRGGPLPSFLAAGAVAVAFQPARERIQRVVKRFVFGQRAEPYAVLSTLGERLESVAAPVEALQAIVESVRNVLGLEGVAIASSNDSPIVVAGRKPGMTAQQIPIHYEQTHVATLFIENDQADRLSENDRRLLTNLARQAGPAIRAHELNLELQRSRRLLVTDQEEERRRIRRDLHDGVGPAVAGLALRAEVVADLIDTDPQAARREISRLKQQLHETTAEIRRLVQGLRPPALDELGLIEAIRSQASALANPSGSRKLAIAVEAAEGLRLLPAAVEVAVLRITGEALTNVARHAEATACVVRLSCDDALYLDVEDNGVGIGSSTRSGVGLASMRERATELGGMFSVTSRPGGGTHVRVELPLRST